jgi:hypothetical protein
VKPVDIQRDAARLATIATVFVWVGWLAVLWAVIAGILWWIDLAGREAFNFLQAFAISSAAIGGPLFLALIVAGLGHTLRLFALYVAASPSNAPRGESDVDPTSSRPWWRHAARRCVFDRLRGGFGYRGRIGRRAPGDDVGPAFIRRRRGLDDRSR